MLYALLGLGILGKLVFITVLIFILLIIGGVGPNSFKTRTTQGVVINCLTKQPIQNASLVFQRRGWGIDNGGLRWDKSYKYTATMDNSGRYTVSYTGEPSIAIISVPGYSNLWASVEMKPVLDLEVNLNPNPDVLPTHGCNS